MWLWPRVQWLLTRRRGNAEPGDREQSGKCCFIPSALNADTALSNDVVETPRYVSCDWFRHAVQQPAADRRVMSVRNELVEDGYPSTRAQDTDSFGEAERGVGDYGQYQVKHDSVESAAAEWERVAVHGD